MAYTMSINLNANRITTWSQANPLLSHFTHTTPTHQYSDAQTRYTIYMNDILVGRLALFSVLDTHWNNVQSIAHDNTTPILNLESIHILILIVIKSCICIMLVQFLVQHHVLVLCYNYQAHMCHLI